MVGDLLRDRRERERFKASASTNVVAPKLCMLKRLRRLLRLCGLRRSSSASCELAAVPPWSDSSLADEALPKQRDIREIRPQQSSAVVFSSTALDVLLDLDPKEKRVNEFDGVEAAGARLSELSVVISELE